MPGQLYHMYKCNGCGQTLIARSTDQIRHVSCGTSKEKHHNKGTQNEASLLRKKGA